MKNKKIILGITGGIAAYKSCVLASLLLKEKAEVKVIMTESAQKFVTSLTFETLTKNRVVTDLFEDREYKPEHIALAHWADLSIIAPATANIIGKIAGGIADDALSTFLLAFEKTVILAPAMNTAMYNHPATKKNMDTLKKWGYYTVGPDKGKLACGSGIGRMSEPENILKYLKKLSI